MVRLAQQFRQASRLPPAAMTHDIKPPLVHSPMIQIGEVPMKKRVVLTFVMVLSAQVFAANNEQIAVAILRDANQKVLGSAILVEDGKGLEVNVMLRNLGPGKVTVSVHENGSCKASNGTAFGAAGNMVGTLNGGMLLETMVGDKGNAFERQVTKLTLSGARNSGSLMRKAFILHSGDTKGPRVACGVTYKYP
jgi:Cu/Zn superoxide dismutase